MQLIQDFKKNQFEKLFHTNLSWICCYDNNIVYSLAAIQNEPFGYTFISEIQNLNGKGYGKILLDYIIGNYPNVYLMCNPEGGNNLLEYYKSFSNLEEFKLDNSICGNVSFFISKNSQNIDKLKKYINNTYNHK